MAFWRADDCVLEAHARDWLRALRSETGCRPASSSASEKSASTRSAPSWTGRTRVKDATYRDLTRLGSGTYGDVYSAYERATGRKVALKETKVGADGESYGFPQNAMREITILKQLDHPNIVALLSVVVALPTATAPESDASDGSNGEGEADGQSATIANAGDADAPSTDALASSIGDTALRGAVFLVFPFCECDLEGYMATAALGKHHVRSFAFQLLAALSHIHARKIAHRDIKGANILVTARNVVKLADWGLARRMNALAPAGGAPPPYDLNIVTLPYRAPEVLLGKRDYDCAVDNWSMGALLAEFLVRPAKVVGGPIQNRPGPIFASGGTESTQLDAIWAICGTPTQESWPGHRQLEFWSKLQPDDLNQPDQLTTTFEFVAHFRGDSDALDLVRRLLVVDPAQRLSAKDALQHAYFWSARSDRRRRETSELRPLRAAGMQTASQAGENKEKRRREEQERHEQHRLRGSGAAATGSGDGSSSSSSNSGGATAAAGTGEASAPLSRSAKSTRRQTKRPRTSDGESAALLRSGTLPTALTRGPGDGSAARGGPSTAATEAQDPWRPRAAPRYALTSGSGRIGGW